MKCPDSSEALAELVKGLLDAARAAGSPAQLGQISEEFLPAPHRPPRALPPGKQALYWFCSEGRALKVGRCGPNSGPRYTSQHYNPRSSQSNLARSILRSRELIVPLVPAEERAAIGLLTEDNVGAWIKRHTARSNLLIDADVSQLTVNLFESWIQQQLNPVFEGPSRRRVKPGTSPNDPHASLPVSADDLARWRRCVRRLLEGLDQGPSPGRGLRSWISGLSHDGRIPRHVASAMILVAESRNVVEYEAIPLSDAEAAAARTSWRVVVEWAASQRLRLPEECGT